MKRQFWLFITVVAFIFTSCQDDSFPVSEDSKDEIKQQDGKTHSHDERTCGLHKHMELLLQDDDYRESHLRKLERVKSASQTRALCDQPVILPIAVHFQGVNNPDEACLVSLAQGQVNILNADYQGLNSDISNWNNNASSYFPGVNNGETCIEFCLATKSHPSGYGLSEGDPAVTINKTNGDNDSNWSGYINIFVRANTGVLGYSPLGGSGNGDGVVVDAQAFGTGSGCGSVAPQSPYNLGRTLTHELGHYLLLDHIWGNGCNVDDDVTDTPDQNSEYYGCPNLGESSCNSNDMHMNYMDYVNDACMYMFSAGQSTRMENFVNTNLSNVVNNAANVCEEGNNGGGNGGGDGDDGGNGEEEDECGAPTSSDVQILSPTKAKVTWTAMPNAIKYRIRYREVGTTSWTVKGAANPKKTLKNLQESTEYEYQLRTKCPSGWTSWSNKFYFSTDGGEGGGDDCAEVTVKITLDDYGSETSFELIAEDGSVIISGGPYQDGQEGTVKTKTTCLEDGCYTLFVDDAYGDGICCDYGEGSIELLDASGGMIAYSDGFFGFYEALDFCVTNGVPEFRKERKDQKSDNLAKKKGAKN